MVKAKHIKLILSIFAGVHLFNCAGTNYKKMSIEDPRSLLAIQDSLILENKNNQNIMDALMTANNYKGKNYLIKGE